MMKKKEFSVSITAIRPEENCVQPYGDSVEYQVRIRTGDIDLCATTQNILELADIIASVIVNETVNKMVAGDE